MPNLNLSFDFVLLDADYDISSFENEDRPQIRLWGRLNSKRIEVRVQGFLPYFYAEASEEEIDRIFQQNEKVVKNWIMYTSKKEKLFYNHFLVTTFEFARLKRATLFIGALRACFIY